MDSGRAHFGFATGPLPRPAVDFTSGSIACRRASLASGPEVGFLSLAGILAGFSFGAAGIRKNFRSAKRQGSRRSYSDIAQAGSSARMKMRLALVRNLTRYVHPAGFAALNP